MPTVKPNDFPEETSPNESNVEFYSQKAGVSRKLPPSAVRKIIAPKVGAAATVPGASGNASILRNKILTDPNGDRWFVDEDGFGVKLNAAIVTDELFQKAANVTGATITATIALPTSGFDVRLRIYREGVLLGYNDDFTVSGSTITLVVPAGGETFRIFSKP